MPAPCHLTLVGSAAARQAASALLTAKGWTVATEVDEAALGGLRYPLLPGTQSTPSWRPSEFLAQVFAPPPPNKGSFPMDR